MPDSFVNQFINALSHFGSGSKFDLTVSFYIDLKCPDSFVQSL